MTTILFLFALLTRPTDRYICDLWTRAITQEGFTQACPVTVLAGLRLDVYSLDMQLVCSKPAENLLNIQNVCGLNAPLDEYVLRIVQPGYQNLLCMVESEHEDAPTPEEIADQCPGIGAEYVIEAAGSRQVTPEAEFSCPIPQLQTGSGLYEQALSADDLVTRDELPYLAGQLIWAGVVKVNDCNGRSGVTPDRVATSCGMRAAHEQMVAWQNQFNNAIYDAALAYHVPAKLLKRMMEVESQFWAFFDKGEDGEVGILQVTDNGLDTLLRFDPDIDPDYTSRDDLAQSWSRNVTRQMFVCFNCSLSEANQQIKINMPYYARLLAAFHCRAVTLNPALSDADSWRETVLDFNGSAEYLLKVEEE